LKLLAGHIGLVKAVAPTSHKIYHCGPELVWASPSLPVFHSRLKTELFSSF